MAVEIPILLYKIIYGLEKFAITGKITTQYFDLKFEWVGNKSWP